MKKLLKNLGVSTAVAAFAVAPVGLVSAHSGTIGTTGPDSTNKIDFRNDARYKVRNENNLSATNNNPQTAVTGHVTVHGNTTSDGDAESGEAMNDSFLSVSADVDNSGSTAAALESAASNMGDGPTASINMTGPDSYNHIEFNNETRVEVRNDNNINITNNNSQTAVSGNVDVHHNTSAGGATSGDASNVSTTTIDLSVTN